MTGLTAVALMTIAFTISSFPQKDQYDSIWQQEQTRKEQEERLKESFERLKKLDKPDLQTYVPWFIDRFVGKAANAWGITIVSQSAFSGTRTIAAVNSDSNILCEIKGKRLLTENAPESLFSLAKAFSDGPPATPPDNLILESYEFVFVHRRIGKSVVTERYPLSASEPKIGALYSALYNEGVCKDS